ncbi:MAG: acyl carrier protein [Eubacterium sp.]|nr:acyl carrier protein [Eubacterium sp.]
MEIADAIKGMLTELRPEFDFENSTDFIEDGLLDSFDIVSLISMIEDEYGISIDGLDIVPENFSGIDAIVELVVKNKGDI